jgi:hypothetical protein
VGGLIVVVDGWQDVVDVVGAWLRWPRNAAGFGRFLDMCFEQLAVVHPLKDSLAAGARLFPGG